MRILIILCVIVLLVIESEQKKGDLKCYMCNSAMKDCAEDGKCTEAADYDRNCYQMPKNTKASKDCKSEVKKEFERQQKVLGERAERWKDHVKQLFTDLRSDSNKHIYEDIDKVSGASDIACATMTIYFPNANSEISRRNKGKDDVITNEPFVFRSCVRIDENHITVNTHKIQANTCFFLNEKGATLEICTCDNKDNCNDEDVGGNFASSLFVPSFAIIVFFGVLPHLSPFFK